MIRIIGKKTLYNTDNKQTARDWAIEPVKKLKTFDAPNVSSGIKLKEVGAIGKNFVNALGYINCGGNNVYNNSQMVALFTSAYSNGHGFGINKDNFDRVVCLFSARRLIIGKYANWINDKDEYLAPDTTNSKYKEFVNDSIIYSLFESASNQSSLRNIEYKNKEKNNE